MTDKIFFKNETLKIVNDDVFSTKEISDGSIDLVVTSPPYNVDIWAALQSPDPLIQA